MAALSGVGMVQVPFQCKAGIIDPVVSNIMTGFIPTWDVAGVKDVSLAPSLIAAENDSGFYEVPFWESAIVDFKGNIYLDVSMLVGFSRIVSSGDLYGAFTSDQSGITSLSVSGNNTISDVTELINVTDLRLQGNNTVNDVTTLTKLTFLLITGDNTISDVTPLTLLTYLRADGDNTISDVTPLTLLRTLLISGNNTISDITPLVELRVLEASGLNTISDVSTLLELTVLRVQGNNTISDISMLTNINDVRITGQNTISVPPVFPAEMKQLFLSGGALLSAEVDSFLAALSLATSWSGSRSVALSSDADPPTAAGLAYIPVIMNNGATSVQVN